MLVAERLDQIVDIGRRERSGRSGNGQLVRLSGVAEIGRAAQLDPLDGDSVPRQNRAVSASTSISAADRK
jgi:hypothetical protein